MPSRPAPLPNPVGPVLAAVEAAPLGSPETPAERAAVLAAMAEAGAGAPAVPHDEVERKLSAHR